MQWYCNKTNKEYYATKYLQKYDFWKIGNQENQS